MIPFSRPRFKTGDLVEYNHSNVLSRVLILKCLAPTAHSIQSNREDYKAWWLIDETRDEDGLFALENAGPDCSNTVSTFSYYRSGEFEEHYTLLSEIE